MTLCVFVLIASEFMPVSLLTPLARDLGVTEGTAGQGIALSGALAVLTSLFLSRLAGNMNRKHLLSGMTVLMALSGIIIAFAPNALMYMAGRALIGIAIGGFWSAATRWRRWSPPRWAVISARPLAGAARFFAWFPWRLWRSSGNILACPTWAGTSGRRHVKAYFACSTSLRFRWV